MVAKCHIGDPFSKPYSRYSYSLYWWSPFKASISHFEAILHVTGASYSPSYLAPRTVKSLGCQLMDVFFRSSIGILGPFSGTVWVLVKLSNTAAKWKGLKHIEKTCRPAFSWFLYPMSRWCSNPGPPSVLPEFLARNVASSVFPL